MATVALEAQDGAVQMGHLGICHAVDPTLDRQVVLKNGNAFDLHIGQPEL
jgi:hypothetical protein